MRRALCLWLFATVVACSSKDEIATRKCTELRDHLVELRLRGLQGSTPSEIDAHRRALTKALGASFVGSCKDNVSSEQLKCVLAAKDSSAAQACSRSVATK